MASKEQLVAQGLWDVYLDKPYENRTVQASQSSNILRSIQAMGDLDQNKISRGQKEAGPAPERSGCEGSGCKDALQVKAELFMAQKEAFCVVEELIKEMAKFGHYHSHAFAVGQLYLENTRPKIS